MTVDQARKKALLLKAPLLEGKDPYAERERGPIDATLGELFQEYRDEVAHCASTKKSIDAAIKHSGGHEGQAFKSKPDG
ncbi:hypothetical protein [Xanthomonas sacchari]|uniref:hypothetical protein n=1 Tax=Xanthomonas sacchari TaxID=56458 RepID=UPI0020C5927B|nr:hypothetical protein [Xanthomonas sacchari]